MKKFLVLILAISLVILSGFSTMAADKTYTIKLGYLGGTDIHKDYEHTMAFVFKTLVEAQTEGKVKVQLYPGAQLGSDVDMLESVTQNIIQGTLANEGSLSRWFPPIEANAIPFLFRSIPVAREMFDGPYGEILKQRLNDEVGLKVLAIGEVGGFLHFATNKRPVPSPGDLKGLKIRTMQHDGHITFIRSIGGAATPMPYTELYTSLQTGLVDGHFNPVSAMVSFKMYEVQDYLTLTGHLYGPNYLVMNSQAFNSFPKNYQDILISAAEAAKVAARGVNTIAEVTGIAHLQEQGMEIYSPTPAQREQFKNLSQEKLIAYFVEKFGEEWVETILEAADEAERKVYSY